MPTQTVAPTAIDSEALGAFAHDIRTPLNAVAMVVDVARRFSTGSDITLDDELAGMLLKSVSDIEKLVADLQDVSRVERGKVQFTCAPAALDEIVNESARILGEEVMLRSEPTCVRGQWDQARLAAIIAEFARAANRSGDGMGLVTLTCHDAPGGPRLHIESGLPGAEERKVAADLGWGFFRARALVQAMGGDVHCERSERYLGITVKIPA